MPRRQPLAADGAPGRAEQRAQQYRLEPRQRQMRACRSSTVARRRRARRRRRRAPTPRSSPSGAGSRVCARAARAPGAASSRNRLRRGSDARTTSASAALALETMTGVRARPRIAVQAAKPSAPNIAASSTSRSKRCLSSNVSARAASPAAATSKPALSSARFAWRSASGSESAINTRDGCAAAAASFGSASMTCAGYERRGSK